LKKPFIVMTIAWAISAPVSVFARDLGVLLLPIHQGKFTSTVMYESLKVHDDFDTRGRSDFKSNVTGAQVSYGVTDQIAVALKGGVFIDPEQDAQGNQWQSRAGYLYGIDLYNEVFPATGLRPGVQLSGGVTGFQVPFDRVITPSGVSLIDQKLSGFDFHGAVIADLRCGRFSPYTGVRIFGRSVDWRDNRPVSGAPDNIHGTSHGNISIVLGLPVQLTQDVKFQVEGILVNETAITAGFTVASF
jgi:hypothetical protein